MTCAGEVAAAVSLAWRGCEAHLRGKCLHKKISCTSHLNRACSLMQLEQVMPSPVGHDVAWQRRLEAGAPSKRPRHKAPLPHLCDDLVRRIRCEGRQISEHLNAEYHRKRYADMSPHIQGLRTAQSQLGMLLHWIRWERTRSAAGSKASFYQGCTIRQALEGLRSDDRQRELEDER